MNSKIPPLFKSSKPAPDAGPAERRAPKAPSASQTDPGASGTTAVAAESVSAPPMTGEGLMKRLRYFENLSEQYEHYIDVLKAVIKRQGGAVPAGYFAPLKGEGGDYTPRA